MTVTSPFSTGQHEVTPEWSTYMDLANDVEPFLQFPSVAEAQRDKRVQAIIDSACYWVQNYLGKPVAPTTFTRRFSGGRGPNWAYITLPYYPVLEVKKVVEFRGVSGPYELTEQTPSNQSGNSEVFQVEPLTGQLLRTFQGLQRRPWFPGSKNIEIQWVAGYDPVPPDIKNATRKLIAHEWRKEQASRSAPAPAGTGEYDADIAMGQAYGGIPHDVIRYLEPYTQMAMG